MQDSKPQLLERLLEVTKKPEPELRALVFEAGLRQMWRDHVLGQYLRGEIDRAAAVDAAGLDWVEMAERQQQAVNEDLEWALGS